MVFFREVVDPPAPPGRLPSVPLLFDSNAARAEQSARLLWSVPDADPAMAGLTDGAMTFKVVSWSDWQDGFEHTDLVDASVATLIGLASVVGDVLAGAHTRGLTVNGQPAVTALRGDLAGREDALADEVVAAAPLDLTQLLADHARFVAALETHGPLLGADLPTEDTPR